MPTTRSQDGITIKKPIRLIEEDPGWRRPIPRRRRTPSAPPSRPVRAPRAPRAVNVRTTALAPRDNLRTGSRAAKKAGIKKSASKKTPAAKKPTKTKAAKPTKDAEKRTSPTTEEQAEELKAARNQRVKARYEARTRPSSSTQ